AQPSALGTVMTPPSPFLELPPPEPEPPPEPSVTCPFPHATQAVRRNTPAQERIPVPLSRPGFEQGACQPCRDRDGPAVGNRRSKTLYFLAHMKLPFHPPLDFESILAFLAPRSRSSSSRTTARAASSPARSVSPAPRCAA